MFNWMTDSMIVALHPYWNIMRITLDGACSETYEQLTSFTQSFESLIALQKALQDLQFLFCIKLKRHVKSHSHSSFFFALFALYSCP